MRWQSLELLQVIIPWGAPNRRFPHAAAIRDRECCTGLHGSFTPITRHPESLQGWSRKPASQKGLTAVKQLMRTGQGRRHLNLTGGVAGLDRSAFQPFQHDSPCTPSALSQSQVERRVQPIEVRAEVS